MTIRGFVPPIGAALVFIAWAPFIGEIRVALIGAFPGVFIPVVGVLVGLALGAPFVVALWRIRSHRLPRYAALAASIGLFAWYTLTFSSGIAEVDTVERFHFLEYGLLGSLFYRAFLPLGDVTIFLMTLLAGVMVGTVEEFVQWLVPVRVGEARDVYLNLFAVLCGVLVGLGLRLPAAFSWRARPGAWRRVCRAAALALVLFAAFFHLAHLGFEIHDDDVGSFRSYWTEDALRELKARRAAEWQRDPPSALTPLAIEDYYLTEAGWHAARRNGHYGNGEFAQAWQENRILEQYYEPFLELRSFSSGAPHRWPPEQRDEVASKAMASVSGPYVSPALRDRIIIWPTKPQFWAGATTLIVLLLGLAGWLEHRSEARRACREGASLT